MSKDTRKKADRRDARNLDLNLLLVIDALLEEHNASQAAKRLGVSQPTISLSLNKLRTLLDDRLFFKTPNGMEPTPRALALREPISAVLRTVQQDILIGTPFSPADTDREFKIATGRVGEVIVLQSIWDRFRGEAPHAKLTILTSGPRDWEMLLSQGYADLAVGFLTDPEKPEFFQETLFAHSLGCVVSADYPMPKGKLTLAQFCKMDHAVIGNEIFANDVYRLVNQRHRIHIDVALRTPHVSSVPHIVPGSAFAVILPKAIAEFFAKDPRMKTLDLPFETPPYAVRHVWHKRLQDDPGAIWLRRLVFSILGNSETLDNLTTG